MKSRNTTFKIILLIFIIIIAFIFLRYSGIMRAAGHERLNIEDIKLFLLSYGKWSAAIFILAYGLKPIILIIPASLLSIVCGMLYGPLFGIFYTMAGAFLAATIAFYIARFLGKDTVEKILKGKTAKLDNNIEKNGFEIMLLMRLAVIFPYDPLSYAAGLSKMRYFDFILGTTIGVLPEMTAYNFIGNNLGHPFSRETIFVIIGVTIIAIISFLVKKAYKGKTVQ